MHSGSSEATPCQVPYSGTCTDVLPSLWELSSCWNRVPETRPSYPSVEALCHVLLGIFCHAGKTIITKNPKPIFYLETGFGQ